MIIPTYISPIDYIETSKMFIFVTAEMILYVNYEEKRFDLQLKNKTVYHRSFDYVLDPDDWFIALDFGLVEWIRQAIDWNEKKSRAKNIWQPFSFKLDRVNYKGKFNPRTSTVELEMPARTIISQRDSITTNYPEIQFIEFGQLITEITTKVVCAIQKAGIEMTGDEHAQLPKEFNPDIIKIGEDEFQFDYLPIDDLALLVIPKRIIKVNLQLIESEVPELTEMHEGMLCDVIRAAVYESS